MLGNSSASSIGLRFLFVASGTILWMITSSQFSRNLAESIAINLEILWYLGILYCLPIFYYIEVRYFIKTIIWNNGSVCNIECLEDVSHDLMEDWRTKPFYSNRSIKTKWDASSEMSSHCNSCDCSVTSDFVNYNRPFYVNLFLGIERNFQSQFYEFQSCDVWISLIPLNFLHSITLHLVLSHCITLHGTKLH